jgi:hypothetical protein
MKKPLDNFILPDNPQGLFGAKRKFDIHTGIDLQMVVDAGQFISQHLGRKAVSRAGNAIAARHAAQS